MSDDELKAKWAKIDNLPDAVDQFMEHSMYVGTDPYYADMNDALWAMLERCRNLEKCKPSFDNIQNFEGHPPLPDTSAEASYPTADGEALAQCCMCGKTGLSTAEDGGPECELHDGRWVCSSECWDIAVSVIDRLLAPRPAEPAPADVDWEQRRWEAMLAATQGLAGNCDETGLCAWLPGPLADLAAQIANALIAAAQEGRE